MTVSEQSQLVPLLEELSGAVEELLLAGLTAASKATVERLDVSFKEASRRKLLRLGSTLRIANEEIVKFTSGSPQFSARRFNFFLSRAWLLATAMQHAIRNQDQAALDRLLFTPVAQPVASLRFVVLGVAKRIVPGAFASFDFRLRAVGDCAPVRDGDPLVWSCVFPIRRELDLPAEAFLHLPQKQGFKPAVLLERRHATATKCAISVPTGGAARLLLSDASKVELGESVGDWSVYRHWDRAASAQRLDAYLPTPLDLEIEFQEEVCLETWTAGECSETSEGYDLLTIESEGLQLSARLEAGPSGVPLRGVVKKLAELESEERPPLYGLAHYEQCRLVFQPLSAWGVNGIEYLTLIGDKISQAEIVKAMKFT